MVSAWTLGGSAPQAVWSQSCPQTPAFLASTSSLQPRTRPGWYKTINRSSGLSVVGNFCPPRCPVHICSGLSSNPSSSRTTLHRSPAWCPRSLDRTTRSGSSRGSRPGWTADTTCTRPTRGRSSPWRPEGWVSLCRTPVRPAVTTGPVPDRTSAEGPK